MHDNYVHDLGFLKCKLVIHRCLSCTKYAVSTEDHYMLFNWHDLKRCAFLLTDDYRNVKQQRPELVSTPQIIDHQYQPLGMSLNKIYIVVKPNSGFYFIHSHPHFKVLSKPLKPHLSECLPPPPPPPPPHPPTPPPKKKKKIRKYRTHWHCIYCVFFAPK